MENRSYPLNQFDELPPDNENSNVGSVHSFTRKNRGKRSQILDEEAKKADEDFWKNNSLFKEEESEHFEQIEHIDRLSEEPKLQEIENEDQNGHDEIEIDEDDDEDEDDEDYEGQTISSEDNDLDSNEEGKKSF